ncbi:MULTISPECIES: FRG domain-containing protein [Vibrio]|uniref:FRG domain-containing protein n=1 Tax=Vibrio TaxID=662 RepID=UPI0022CDB22D|nr:FRG domain-containing protein [Vibrio sp. MM46]MDA0126333.1 FRG domain-containing protein [Vibrio sp. MM46]
MTVELLDEWKYKLSTVRIESQKYLKVSSFKNLAPGEATRAAYFTEIAPVLKQLGLSNPHEKSALTLEPTHPVLNSNLEKAFKRLKLNPSHTKLFKDAKLSLISLKMLRSYAPDSDASKMLNAGIDSPLYLLDPLYGFVFIPVQGRMSNHCFAIDLWGAHLESMPKLLSQKLWKDRANSMLSGGASAGRLLFKELLPEETDPLKLASPAEIIIDSEEELDELVEKLRSLAQRMPEVDLWFRGQSKDYVTPDRLELAKVGIAPYSNIQDSNLTPSLYRHYDSFTDNIDYFEKMTLDLAEWVFHAKKVTASNEINEQAPLINGVSSVTSEGLRSYQHGLVLQQYGAPSAYLDITKDHNIAAWFATHRCQNNEQGKMEFTAYNPSNEQPEDMRTIFVFPLVKGVHPYLDLNSILSESEALRAVRQKCGLLGGAGNLARNYCARYLGLKIRLGSNFQLSKPLRASDLFPPECEDKVLKMLKEEGMDNQDRLFPVSELA